jgi:hypothetical protein
MYFQTDVRVECHVENASYRHRRPRFLRHLSFSLVGHEKGMSGKETRHRKMSLMSTKSLSSTYGPRSEPDREPLFDMPFTVRLEDEQPV